MKKRIVKILEIESCDQCYHYEEYGDGKPRCREAERWIRSADIPKWCPLESPDSGEPRCSGMEDYLGIKDR